jgi:hypothetical protein
MTTAGRDRVWGRLGEIDWDKYGDVPDDRIDVAHYAFVLALRKGGAPVDAAEAMVGAVLNDGDPDLLLGLFAVDVLAKQLGGQRIRYEVLPEHRDAFGYAVAAILAVNDLTKKIEAEEIGC